jgi:hypothetical protein
MKKIKNAKSISDLIVAVSKQAKKEPCRIGVVFSDSSDVEKLLLSRLVVDLPWKSWSNNMLKVRLQLDASSYSAIDFFAMDIPRMRGKRYDYILMDSKICDEGKAVLRACTVKYFGFFLGKDMPQAKRQKDKRKNAIQEFTLAEEWPLLSKTK